VLKRDYEGQTCSIARALEVVGERVHDDGEREFDYTSGAEQALERAVSSGWTVVNMKED
jgi:hypothetical protein